MKMELSPSDVQKAIEMFMKSKGIVVKSTSFKTHWEYDGFMGYGDSWFTGVSVEVENFE